MARKTKQESLETRQHILETAAAIFSERGVSRTSLNEIAVAAGVSRGAIYWHFKNKVELFNALWSEMESNIDDVEKNFMSNHPNDPLLVLRQVLIYVLQFSATDTRQRTLMEILFHKCEFVGEMISLMEARQVVHLSSYERIEQTLRNCIEHQQLPAQLNTHLAAIMMRSYVGGLIENWLFMPESFNLNEKAVFFADAFIDMLKHSEHLRQGISSSS
jgi:TetR/AcrR family acrAB operon transcriptional repressor